MYLSVQRVRSSLHERGINGALYLHSSVRQDSRWSHPNLRAVVMGDVGKQAVARVDIAPGGNAVESLLDIVCPDDVSATELRNALDRFYANLNASRQSEVCGSIEMEFSLNVAGE